MLYVLSALLTEWTEDKTTEAEERWEEDQEVLLLFQESVPAEEWFSEKLWVEDNPEQWLELLWLGEERWSNLTGDHAEETEHALVEESNSGREPLFHTEELLDANVESTRERKTGNALTTSWSILRKNFLSKLWLEDLLKDLLEDVEEEVSTAEAEAGEAEEVDVQSIAAEDLAEEPAVLAVLAEKDPAEWAEKIMMLRGNKGLLIDLVDFIQAENDNSNEFVDRGIA